MVQTLGTSASNDLYLSPTGNLVVLSGLQAVLAACATVAKSQLKEMVLAQNAGIPNFQTVWTGVPNLAIWKQYLRSALENVPGVIQVTSLTASVSQGIVSYTVRISSEFGEGTIHG